MLEGVYNRIWLIGKGKILGKYKGGSSRIQRKVKYRSKMTRETTLERENY